jgi:Phosphoribosyl transferase (PRTase)/PELOTA RNA binding domain
MTLIKPFTGSYGSDDVHFLLKPMAIEHTPVNAKEKMIQSGEKHYSEMLSHEMLPSEDYLALFFRAMTGNQERIAKNLIYLAKRIYATRKNSITLVSLARAGTPIGVLLKHILKKFYAADVSHYSISILRDVGIDYNALRFILKNHAPESLVFVDGWTGKGTIAEQLNTCLQAFAKTDGVVIPAELYVITDLCGAASVSAGSEDYLIPSSLLNATVSGLVSRSILTKNSASSSDFHGCVYYQQFEPHDLSRYFVDILLAKVISLWQSNHPLDVEQADRQHLQAISRAFLSWISEKYGVSQYNYIKPGIGEATRVLLRREAQCLLLREIDAEATLHLRWLAEAKSIPIIVFNNLPYRAVALIKEI